MGILSEIFYRYRSKFSEYLAHEYPACAYISIMSRELRKIYGDAIIEKLYIRYDGYVVKSLKDFIESLEEFIKNH